MTVDYCDLGLLPVRVGCFPLELHTLDHLHLSFYNFIHILLLFYQALFFHSTNNFNRLQSCFLISFSLIYISSLLSIGCCYSKSFFPLAFPLHWSFVHLYCFLSRHLLVVWVSSKHPVEWTNSSYRISCAICTHM